MSLWEPIHMHRGGKLYVMCPFCNAVSPNPEKCFFCSKKLEPIFPKNAQKTRDIFQDLLVVHHHSVFVKKPPPTTVITYPIKNYWQGVKRKAPCEAEDNLQEHSINVARERLQKEVQEQEKRILSCTYKQNWKYCARCNPELGGAEEVDLEQKCTREDLIKGMELTWQRLEEAHRSGKKSKAKFEASLSSFIHYKYFTCFERMSKREAIIKLRELSLFHSACNPGKGLANSMIEDSFMESLEIGDFLDNLKMEEFFLENLNDEDSSMENLNNEDSSMENLKIKKSFCSSEKQNPITMIDRKEMSNAPVACSTSFNTAVGESSGLKNIKVANTSTNKDCIFCHLKNQNSLNNINQKRKMPDIPVEVPRKCPSLDISVDISPNKISSATDKKK